MISFPYIEDYLECIAGYMPSYKNPARISLARYDTAIVNSLASQTIGGVALTDRQLELVKKIVAKYRRQLAQYKIDIGDQAVNPVLRMPVRRVDRTKSISVVNNTIHIKFQYDTEIIKYLREYNDLGLGSIRFDSDLRIWVAGITEPVILFLSELVDKYVFTVDSTFQDMTVAVRECEQLDYRIELTIDQDKLSITNAADSLIEHLNNNCGGLELDNLLRLADLSGNYAYGISDELTTVLNTIYGEETVKFLVARQHHTQNIDAIATYAAVTNRYPIYVYAMQPEFLKSDLQRIFSQEELSFGLPKKPNPNLKCIVTSKINDTVESIPLLITTQAMMLGTKRTFIMQLAEKIFFHTDTIFHNLNKK